MKVSYEWLKSMVELPEDPSELACEFIRTGTEVESIDTVGEAYHKIVTAKVVSKEAHPDSDHLWVTLVDVGANNVDADGNPEPLQIVCGAQNFNEGDHIVTAMIGAELPGDVHIKKGKLRGVVSCGMNCSQRELGLSGDHEGIWILPADAPVGMPLAQYLGSSDTVLDCEITSPERSAPSTTAISTWSCPRSRPRPARPRLRPSPSSSSTRACATATSPAWCAASRWAPRPNGSSSA